MIQKRDQFPPIFLPSHIDGASPNLQLKNTPKSSIGILNGIPQTDCMPIRPILFQSRSSLHINYDYLLTQFYENLHRNQYRNG